MWSAINLFVQWIEVEADNLIYIISTVIYLPKVHWVKSRTEKVNT